MKKWRSLCLICIIFLCCLSGCGSTEDITEPAVEEIEPTESGDQEDISVYPADLDVFYSLESFLEYAATVESGGVADLTSLEYFYLPTGIPDGYRLYKITAAKNDIGFWYLPEDACASDDTILTAELRSEHFIFISPRAHESWFAGDETLLTWQENTDLLMLYLPKDFVVENRETLCSAQKYVRTEDNTFKKLDES